MNPHDPLKRPGAHLVAEKFDVDDPWSLSSGHRPQEPLNVIGKMVATAAEEVDELHAELTRLARHAIELLEPIGMGKQAWMLGSDGVLSTTGPRIELLVARRSAAYRQLTRAVSAYQRLPPEPASAAPDHNLGLTAGQEPGRYDDRALSGHRQLAAPHAVHKGGLHLHPAPPPPDQAAPSATQFTALQEIEQGAVTVRERGVRAGQIVSTSSGVRISVATVTSMEKKNWIARDTSTSLYQGQSLSLTERGEATLKAARAAEPRVSAALQRSHSAPNPAGTPHAATPTLPDTKPSRSR